MALVRNGASFIKTALVRALRTGFTHTRVPGLTANPLIIQDRPLNSIDEPYIYIYTEEVTETNKTKDRSSNNYFIIAQVVVRVLQNEDGSRTRDAIVDEITNLIDTNTDGYIGLVNDGFNVYEQNIENVILLDKYEERGGTYFQANVTIQIEADFIDLPQDRDPVQQAVFTFNGFTFPPTNNRIECFDSGRITGDTSYPSNNNGWDFRSVTYSLIGGGQGTLTGNNLDVDTNDDPLGLITETNYEFGTDNTISTSITDTDTCLLYTSPSPRDS